MTYEVGIELHETLAESERAVLDVAALTTLLERVLTEEAVEDETGLTVVLAGDELLQELNREHRDLDEPTDVLSFPAEEGEPFPGEPEQARYVGDIAVSVARVTRQAEAASIAADLELRHVLVHGLLHLLGYDHETPEDDAHMRAREEAVLGAAIHAGRADEAHSD